MKAATARAEINRENAQHSTGPRTEQGKYTASRNHTKHGLFAVRTPSEEQQRFMAPLSAELAPANFLERELAESIAADYFRLKRIRQIENAILTGPSAFLENSKELERLTLYESRIGRAIQRNMKELQALQKTRKAAQAKSMEEAKLLAQLALMEGHTYDPTSDGFDFSPAEINTAINREARLKAARNHQTKIIRAQSV